MRQQTGSRPVLKLRALTRRKCQTVANPITKTTLGSLFQGSGQKGNVNVFKEDRMDPEPARDCHESDGASIWAKYKELIDKHYMQFLFRHFSTITVAVLSAFRINPNYSYIRGVRFGSFRIIVSVVTAHGEHILGTPRRIMNCHTQCDLRQQT